MSYQVIARKYRPQRFSEVIGQEHITTTLRNALSSGRIHHAYLFTGVRGVGKTTVARILARALNCQHPKDFEPCGECGPCREISAGNSMDVQEIDGASNNSVDNVREIREHAKYLPSSGRYKIYIIDEVHMLSDSAFNALLKTLEEPPPHLLFIFATTEAHDIPATILSRCQRHDFRRIGAPQIAAALKRIAREEKIDASDDALALIAREATGSLRDAQSLFDQAIAYAGTTVSADAVCSMLGSLDRTLVLGAIQAAFAQDASAALDVLERIYVSGADLARFSQEVLEVLRHLILLAECGKEKPSLDLPADEIALLAEIAAATDAPRLHQMFSLWYGVAESVARSPFPKMLLEVGLIRLCRVQPVKPVQELIARLDAAIAGAAAPTANPGVARNAPQAAAAPRPAAAAVIPASPAKPRLDAAPEPPPPPAPSKGPTFESAAADFDSQRRWEEFLRIIATERPQAAAILQQATLEGIEENAVRVRFGSQHFADLQSEEPRRAKVEEMLTAFFKRPIRLLINAEEAAAAPKEAAPSRTQRKKELVREALGSDIVKQAAEILGAQLHEVKTADKA